MAKFIKYLGYLLLVLGSLIVEQVIIFGLVLVKDFSFQLFLSFMLIAVVLLLVYIAYRLQLIEGKFVLNHKKDWKQIALSFLALYVIKAVGGVVVMLETGEQTTQNQAAIESMNLSPFLLILLTVIIAPIFEEVVFRGIIQKGIFQQSYLGVVVSSIAFCLLHAPTNLGSWIIYGGMGAVLGLLYRKTDSLQHTIAVHFINNALAVCLMLFVM